MRGFFELFNLNCSTHLVPPEHLCIDEMLFPTRSKVNFKHFNAKKPNKYGVLLRSLNSCKWPYTHAAIVEAGKPVNGSGPHYINNIPDKVKKLVNNQERKHEITGRNISTDRYYTSVQVADWLLKDKKVTIVGTMMSNRVGLPKQLVDAKNMKEHTYQVFWDASNYVLNLHSYTVVNKSTGKKNVLLLSTVEPILGTTKKSKEKRPQVIELYNFSKGGYR